MKHSSTRTSGDRSSIAQISEIINRLNSDQWPLYEKVFALTLQKKNPWTEQMLNTYNYFYIGGESLSFPQLVARAKQQGFGSFYFDDMKELNLITSSRPKQVPFALKTMQGVGFEGRSYQDWIDFIKNHPLYALCSVEDVFYIRKKYISLEDENVYMAMNPIESLNPHSRQFFPHIFSLIEYMGSQAFSSHNLILMNGMELRVSDHERQASLWFLRFKK